MLKFGPNILHMNWYWGCQACSLKSFPGSVFMPSFRRLTQLLQKLGALKGLGYVRISLSAFIDEASNNIA